MPKTTTCQCCKNTFETTNDELAFYEKIKVPSPTFCARCRTQRRFAFRNERKLFKRKDALDGKEIFSMHPPEAKIKVLDVKNWHSDKWDPMEHGQDYNLGKNFFDQFKELSQKVPWPSRTVANMENSDYCLNAESFKNCYCVFNGTINEDCAFCDNIENSRDCFDCYYLRKCELCSEGFMLRNCYQTRLSSNCKDCQNVLFCKNCSGCSDCFGCVNLRHKKYHIFNQEYSKNEYFYRLRSFNLGSHEKLTEKLSETKNFWLKHPVRFMEGTKNVQVTGEYINNCKNVTCSYFADNAEDTKHSQFCFLTGTRNCQDCTVVGWDSKFCHENVVIGQGINNLKFCLECWPRCSDIEYCIYCKSSSDLFGCIGLHNKQYCILNKQYTKEEYFDLVAKIKKHMGEMPFTSKNGCIYKYGEFFPPETFPFSYNNTIAQEYFPLTKEQALKKGYRWYDKAGSEYKPMIKARSLPDRIKDASNNILEEIIHCQNEEKCQGSEVFRLIPKELQFYKKHNLPIPRLCPDCRHHERIKQRNPMELHKRQCMCDNKEHNHANGSCKNTFETTYAPDRKEIVYCKECYQREVE